MRKHLWLYVVIGGLMMLLPAGCSNRNANTAKVPPGVTLPAWAPKAPSKEFVRTAAVIKPYVPEDTTDPRKQADTVRVHGILPTAWEFFGTLDDGQIHQLQTAKSLEIPYNSLTTNQHDKLNNFFAAWRTTMKGVPADSDFAGSEDAVTALQQLGAKADLSNVIIVFKVGHSGTVCFGTMITQPSGATGPFVPFVGLGTT